MTSPTPADPERRHWWSRHGEDGTAAWHELMAPHVARFGWLDGDQLERLEHRAATIVSGRRWEGARGFEVTDEMQLTIAALAALLIVELDERSYHDVTSIIVHPSTIVLREERRTGAGLVSNDPQHLLGAAHYKGPVLLSWEAIVDDLARPGGGDNVVLHEFAHRLDMLDGLSDGTPVLPDPEARSRWVAVCSGEYLALRGGEPDDVLRGYAGVNPAEFFAVATEVFFTRPAAMRTHKPDLYRVLADFYRQDPATAI